MPRLARLVVPGLPHHVTQRGSRRQPTFFADADYRRYLELLERAARREGLEVPIHCLMPNHVHLIVVPSTAKSLARTLYLAHRRYAEEINARHGWTGHLWQERFRSCPMDAWHTWNAARYVLNNPVRAGLVREPAQWPWSSARTLLRGGWERRLETLGLQHADPAALLAYSDLAEFADQLHVATRRGRPLGDESFVADLERRTGRSLKPSPLGRKARFAVVPSDPSS